MKRSEFDFYLPPELIAQEPPARRGLSRMMVVDKITGKVADRVFREITEFLQENDVIVLNDVKVIPARLKGEKKGTGGKVEVLLLKEKGANVWEVLAKGRKLKEGSGIIFPGEVKGYVVQDLGARKLVRFETPLPLRKILDEVGEIPLPPYIKKPTDRSFKKYQTVYARKEGAIAAPTAGFHFTEGILRQLREKGVNIAFLTLYVGAGTFLPIKAENIEEHSMEEEYFEVSEDASRIINRSKEKGGRVVAVGTTVVRTLETVAKNGKVYPVQGKTSIFIIPGYKFKIVDVLLTNFHLPSSTPLLLACAFAGREIILNAYREAVKKRYRFYSFGDAMLII
ncbi:MAG: tRNA preQ1(34) S-adenosylmethionine ribosyltransferase-isomerase QueA [Caldiserica bacterium]|nr:tRNA preQ1(34) S-adenosylmethionine ribosyltransferase-isomerase QueA [Caldisericota bacterium]